MEIDKNYDLVVIGGGPGGYVSALQAARKDLRVAMIEEENIGGTCLNWGCIPTKALISSAGIYNDLDSAGRHGIKVQEVELDYSRMSSRKDRVVKKLVRGVEHLLDQAGVEVYKTRGKLLQKDVVELQEEKHEAEILGADRVIIATGSKPVKPPIPGLELPGVLSSRDLLSLQELPESMVIIGAGIIGMEFASLLGNLGCDVTVLEMRDQILPGLDADIAGELENLVKRKGVEVHTDSCVEAVKKSSEEKLQVEYEQEGEKCKSTGDKVLLAAGRKPNLTGINPEEMGLEHDSERGGITVDSRMETSLEGVYAVGDVTDKMMLAHVAFHQGIIAVNNILGETRKMDYSAVPSVIFSDPEVAVVGMREEEVKEAGINYNTARFPFRANGKVLAAGERRGFIKMITREDDNRILGCAIIGLHASDLISSPALALNKGLSALDIAETIHAHPTTSEVVHEAAMMAAAGQALHY